MLKKSNSRLMNGTMKVGIDLSSHNRDVDYSKITGVDFAILRSSYGVGYEDMLLAKHLKGLKEAGVPVIGFYHFMYAGTVEDAKNNAIWAAQTIRKYGIQNCTIWCDFEYDTVDNAEKNGMMLGPADCRTMTDVFCKEIENQGFKTGVYCNPDYYKNWYGFDFLKPYRIWLAEYNCSEPDFPCEIWQSKDDGKISGIIGNVDVNYLIDHQDQGVKGSWNMSLTKNVNGTNYEVLRAPMKNFQVSQGCNGVYSHQGVPALDLCGKDTGIEPTYAPCEMKYIAHDSAQNGNAIFFQSVRPVLFADGTVDYATFMFIHDNYIDDIIAHARQIGTFKQWEEFGDEGTTGMATGNHCHFEVAKGRYTHMYDQNGYGTWHLPGSIHPDKAIVMDGVNLIHGGQPQASGDHMNWITSDQIPVGTRQSNPKVTASHGWNRNATVHVGDKVRSVSVHIAPVGTTGSAIQGKCVNIPAFSLDGKSKAMVPLADISEASDTGDGKKDEYLANTYARVTLDECTVEAVDTARNLVKVHGYWINAYPLEVKQ